MKNGEKIYVVCAEEFFRSAHWPCSIFAKKEDALEECKRRAEECAEGCGFFEKKPREGSKFFAERAKGPKGQDGYGRKRDQNDVEWSWLDHSVVYYVQEYELGKKADEVELWA